MDSIKGVLVGLVMFVASFALLFWNEGRAVHTAQALEEGAASVVSVAADKIDPANENKLVHVSAVAVAADTLRDKALGIDAPGALRLARAVSMYQWKENKKTTKRKRVGGSEERVTTYSYEKVWSDRLIDSNKFNEAAQHPNPKQMAVSSKTFDANAVTVGAFTLPEAMLRELPAIMPLPATATALAALPAGIKDRAKLDDGRIYVGTNPADPNVGDLRIAFRTLPSGPVSLVARQSGESFQPYPTKAGMALSMIERGTVAADLMFKRAKDANTMLTWILRGVGWLVMAIGIALVFNPMVVLADVLPLVGNLLGAGIAIFALVVSIVLSLITIAIAWLAYRPLIGGGLLAAAIALLVIFKMTRKPKPKPQQAG